MKALSRNEILAKNIIKSLNHDLAIQKFSYSKSFINCWKEELLYYAQNDASSILPSQMKADPMVKDQMYECITPLLNSHFTFRFNVKYLLNSIDDERFFHKIILKNKSGILLYKDIYKCNYTHFLNSEIKPSSEYPNVDNVLITPSPSSPYEYVVVDGNHRVFSQINENKEVINAYVVDKTIAAASLCSTFETCLYTLLLDIATIEKNIGNMNDFQLKESLSIFSDKSSLTLLRQRAAKQQR